MAKTWTIGSDPRCDLKVAAPASGQHCQLTIGLGGALIEDLGSAEGTYVNQVRITGVVPVNRADAITLGPSLPMPWPTDPPPFAPVVLRIGRDPENDFVVDLPTVSSRHARMIWSGKRGEAEIEDLGSANGTALNSPERKVSRASVTARDTVYLGLSPISGAMLLSKVDPTFPRILTLGASEIVIGRAPECQQVVELPTVSGRHARLSRSAGRAMIEDLGSANGTFVNGRRIDQPTPLEPGDLIGLGLHMMRFDLGASVDPPRAARTIAEPIPSGLLPPITLGEAASKATQSLLATSVRPLILIAQAPVLAILIVAVFGGGSPSRSVGSIPAILFLLGLVATWFGLSSVVIGNFLGISSTPIGVLSPGATQSIPARLGWLGLTCVGQCLLLWGIVATMSGLRGSWFSSLILLILASLVGSSLGILIEWAVPRRALAWAILPVALLLFWQFGGGPGSLSRIAPWAKMVSTGTPSRWAFEGLLLLESENASPTLESGDSSAWVEDMAERFFPAETERMGPSADALALASMLVGLSAWVAFVSRPWASDFWARAET